MICGYDIFEIFPENSPGGLSIELVYFGGIDGSNSSSDTIHLFRYEKDYD